MDNDTLVIPKGFIYDETKGSLISDLYVNNGKYYTTEVNEGLFFSFVPLNASDEAGVYRWYVQALASTNQPQNVVDPFKTAKPITDEQVRSLQIDPEFPKIGKDFIRLAKLYQTFCVGGLGLSNSALEVGVVLFFHPVRKELRFVLPTQKVLSTHWGWSMKHKEKAFFLDGEETSLDQLEAEGWIKCGSSHSHNTMNITWSDLDRKDQVGTPQAPKMTAIHILLYGFRNHADLTKEPDFNVQISASVNGHWQDIDPELILDFDCEEEFAAVDFDPTILSIVKENAVSYTRTYPAQTRPSAGFYYQGKTYYGSQPKPIVGNRPYYAETVDEAALIRHGAYTQFYDKTSIVALISDLYNLLISAKGLDYVEAVLEVAKENDSFKEALLFIEALTPEEAAEQAKSPEKIEAEDGPFFWRDDSFLNTNSWDY